MFRIGFLSPRIIIKDFTAGGKYVSAVTGNTTVRCSYRITLLNSAGEALWTDSWRVTSGTAFSVSLANSGTYLVQTVRMELKALCARAPSCATTVMTYQVTGSHQVVSGSHQVVSGSHQVQSGTHQVQSGSHQVQSGSHWSFVSQIPYEFAWNYAGTVGGFYSWWGDVHFPVPASNQRYQFPPLLSEVPPYTYDYRFEDYSTSGIFRAYIRNNSYPPTPTDSWMVVLLEQLVIEYTTVLDYITVIDYATVTDYTTVTDYATVLDYGWVSSQLSL